MSAKDIQRLARVLFESEPPHKDCSQEVLDGAWASTDCDFKTSRVASVRAILQALREPSEEMLEAARHNMALAHFEPVGLETSWQAMIDHILAD